MYVKETEKISALPATTTARKPMTPSLSCDRSLQGMPNRYHAFRQIPSASEDGKALGGGGKRTCMNRRYRGPDASRAYGNRRGESSNLLGGSRPGARARTHRRYRIHAHLGPRRSP